MVQVLANAMATANQFQYKHVPGQVSYSTRLWRVRLPSAEKQV